MNMSTLKRLLAAAVLISLAALAACSRSEQQAAERKLEQSAANVERKAEQLGEAIDDATLTARVKTALIAEPEISAFAVNVDTKDQVVTLSGEYDTQAHAERAVAVATAVEGVKSVVNHLKVKPNG
jgi:hyperosmotically inducible protein